MLLMSISTISTVMAQEQNNHKHETGSQGSANEYMHQSKIENLVERFESTERDTYQQPNKVITYLGDIKGKTIMDLGAGSGYFSVKLATAGANVIAADVNEDFLLYLKNRIKNEKIENIQLRKIPYDNPMLSENEVDILFIVNTYHHIEKRTDYFAKALRGIKKGGELLIIDFFKVEAPIGPPVDHKTSIDEVITELKEAGYTSFEIEVSLLPYQYIIKAK